MRSGLEILSGTGGRKIHRNMSTSDLNRWLLQNGVDRLAIIGNNYDITLHCCGLTANHKQLQFNRSFSNTVVTYTEHKIHQSHNLLKSTLNIFLRILYNEFRIKSWIRILDPTINLSNRVKSSEKVQQLKICPDNPAVVDIYDNW